MEWRIHHSAFQQSLPCRPNRATWVSVKEAAAEDLTPSILAPGSSAFQADRRDCGRILSPLARGTTGSVVQADEDPLPPKNARSFLKASIPLGKGDKSKNSLPGVEEVASCDLFYLGLLILRPWPGLCEERGLPASGFCLAGQPREGFFDRVKSCQDFTDTFFALSDRESIERLGRGFCSGGPATAARSPFGRAARSDAGRDAGLPWASTREVFNVTLLRYGSVRHSSRALPAGLNRATQVSVKEAAGEDITPSILAPGSSAFQLTDATAAAFCPPWQGGPQGVWYKPTKTPCRQKTREAFSKLRFPWERGTNLKTPYPGWKKSRPATSFTTGYSSCAPARGSVRNAGLLPAVGDWTFFRLPPEIRRGSATQRRRSRSGTGWSEGENNNRHSCVSYRV